MDSEKDIFEKISSHFTTIVGFIFVFFLLLIFLNSVIERWTPDYYDEIRKQFIGTTTMQIANNKIHYSFPVEQLFDAKTANACVSYFYHNDESFLELKKKRLREPYNSMKFTEIQIKTLCQSDHSSFLFFKSIESVLIDWQAGKHR